MRNFLAFVGASVVVVLGLGYYLGWYRVTPQKSTPGQARLQLDINQDKISEDVKYGAQKGAEKIQELIDKNRDNSATTPTSSNDLTRPVGGQLQPPSTGERITPTTKPSKRAEEAFKGLILDGWFSSDKK